MAMPDVILCSSQSKSQHLPQIQTAKDAHHTNPATCSRGFLGFFCKSQIFRMEGLGLSRKQLISSLNKAYLPSAVDCEGWCDFHCTAMALGRNEKTRGRQKS